MRRYELSVTSHILKSKQEQSMKVQESYDFIKLFVLQSNDFCLTAASVEELVADFQVDPSTGQSEIVLEFNDTAADSKFQILANSQVSNSFSD